MCVVYCETCPSSPAILRFNENFESSSARLTFLMHVQRTVSYFHLTLCPRLGCVAVVTLAFFIAVSLVRVPVAVDKTIRIFVVFNILVRSFVFIVNKTIQKQDALKRAFFGLTANFKNICPITHFLKLNTKKTKEKEMVENESEQSSLTESSCLSEKEDETVKNAAYKLNDNNVTQFKQTILSNPARHIYWITGYLLSLSISGKDTIDYEDVGNVVLLKVIGRFSGCYLLLQSVFTYIFLWYRVQRSCISILVLETIDCVSFEQAHIRTKTERLERYSIRTRCSGFYVAFEVYAIAV
ncbi:uncharacterized protein EV154DRAFT_481829 [Mucor mucedo]|uniref:uncharacterized protein n=1 Tax=Mucor mucedo TaxID=29922 RepID=UPI0022208F62|nr:uncharacterized protein EV154DRAFT_481829 [Mucor mucedo]KAI7890838.1 hypothetical protein EV154DRAFT_481829 [Mucor mucedo]